MMKGYLNLSLGWQKAMRLPMALAIINPGLSSSRCIAALESLSLPRTPSMTVG